MGKIILNGITYGGGSGGGVSTELTAYDYAEFNGGSYIALPLTVDADYKITVDFYIPNYVHNMGVIGTNQTGSSRLHLTEYNNKWYASTGNGEQAFYKSLTGRHIFVNNVGGKNTFDGDAVTNYTPTTLTSHRLAIGTSQGSATTFFRGKIYSYKIESIASGDVILDIIPAQLKIDDYIIKEGLFDTISKRFYESTAILIGND